MDTGMPLSAPEPSGRMRSILWDIRQEYRQGGGNQEEKLWEFRNRMTEKLNEKVTAQELDRSLPAVFRPYRIYDEEEQHGRTALMEWMRRAKIEAATAGLDRREQSVPNSIRDALPVIRYYLEKTGRKDFANEFENVMATESDTEIARRLRINDREGKLKGAALEEATKQEKNRRALARGKILAQLARDFAYMDPEDIADPAKPNDFKMHFTEYHYLNSLAHCLEQCLNGEDAESEIRFEAEERKKCRHIQSFQEVTDRFEGQVDLICNPYYPYLDTGKISRDMKPDKVRQNCMPLVREGGYLGTLGLDLVGGTLAVDNVRTTAIYRRTVKEKKAEEQEETAAVQKDSKKRYEEAANAAGEAMNDMEEAYNKELQPLVKQVCKADPFYMVFSSPEYSKIKEHMLAYAAVRIVPDPADDTFETQLKQAAKETKKLMKYSRMYLKHRGVDEGKKNKRDRRIDAARAVEKFSTAQFERLKKIAKNRKTALAALEEETRERDSLRNRNTVGAVGKAPHLDRVYGAAAGDLGRADFYKNGKRLLESGYRKDNEAVMEVNRRLKEMFSPENNYDLYAMLGLDGSTDRKTPLTGEALTAANGLMECLMVKMVIKNVQDICESNGKESSITQMTGKMSFEGLRDVVRATPTYQNVVRDINGETVYDMVTGNGKSDLTELSRKVTMELSGSASRLISEMQQGTSKSTGMKKGTSKDAGMQQNTPKSTGMEGGAQP